MPGYMDMHTHCHTTMAVDFLSQFGPRIEGSAHRDWFLRLFLAFGVTTVRDVGNFSEILDMKRVYSDGGSAPAIFAAGELLEGPEPLWPLSRKVADEESAREEVRRQKDMGADWVKLYAGLDSACAEAAIREAHSVGLRVAGHIGRTTARQAARAGIDTLEHATTLADEEFLSREDRASLPGKPGGKYQRDRFRQTWAKADLESEAAMDLVDALGSAGTAICPTLVVHENTMVGPSESFQDFAFDHVPRQWLETWEGRMRIFKPPGEQLPNTEMTFKKALGMVSLLHSHGIRILGGTDAALWNPYVVPGASLHRELELLVAAGLSNQQALESVTCVAAEELGAQNRLGTVEEGKRADLVLLGSNPLEDISSTREIKFVISKGRVFSPEDLLQTTDARL